MKKRMRIFVLALVTILLFCIMPITTSAYVEMTPELLDILNQDEIQPGQILNAGAPVASYNWGKGYDGASIEVSTQFEFDAFEIIAIGDCLEISHAVIVYANGTAVEGIRDIYSDGERITFYNDPSRKGMRRELFVSVRLVAGKSGTSVNWVYDHKTRSGQQYKPVEVAGSPYKPTREKGKISINSIVDRVENNDYGAPYIYTKPDNLPSNSTTPKLTLNKKSLNMEKGITKPTQITATVSPGGTTVEWSSSKKSVATVSNRGVITAVGVGAAIITAKGNNGLEATCTVTVWEKSVKLNAKTKTLKVGETFTLVPTVNPNQKSNKVEWVSNNPNIATVSSTGKVTAKKAGKAKVSVKVTFKDGKQKSAGCNVVVE